MLEKLETMKKSDLLNKILTNKKVKYIIGTLLLSGIGITLPRIFHILAGTNAGAIFLPMHIAVLIASLTFGTFSGTIVALNSIIFNYVLTGMPTLARLPYMLIELVIYAVLLSVLNKKFNSYVSLIVTIILGRVFYAGVLFMATSVFGLSAYGISVIQSVQMGIPGILIQLIFIPFIAKEMNKRININN